MNLLVLLLITLPACLAQFTLQGPSDGNRVAQGFKVEEGKGVQYTDQNDPHGGGFTIQGATDGHSQVQSGTDGHTNFQIQGASSGGAERYFQGPTAAAYDVQRPADGHAQSIIQGSYDTKSLQYNDPSGLRVSWKSYDRQAVSGPQQQVQYSEAPAVPRAPHRQRAPVQRQSQPQPRLQSRLQPRPQPQPELESIPIQQQKTFSQTPMYIKQLLQYQQQLPYVNIIPEPLRYENLLKTQDYSQANQPTQYQPEIQEQVDPEPRRPAYRGKSRGPPRQRRQAPHNEPRPQYQRPPQQAEPKLQYSTNLPPQIRQLLKFQAETPYASVIPEQYRFNPVPDAQRQLKEIQTHYQSTLREQPSPHLLEGATFGGAPVPVPGHHRERRQAPQHQQQPQQQPQRQQLPAEPQLHYSTNLPDHLQKILQFQAQIPYDIIANQISYRPEKPYVPQPVQPSASSPEVQYQGQSSGYNQAQYPQGQAGYGQAGYQQTQQGVRPVTEHQY